MADAKDCVEMLKLPKDMILSLYSFKINSGSTDSLLPVVVSDILLSSKDVDVLLILKFTSRNFWLKKKKCVLCGRHTDAYRFTASTLL